MLTYQTWSNAITQSVTDILTRIVDFIPRLVGAAVIIIVGWAIGALLQWAVENLLRAAGAQTLFEKIRLEEMLQRADLEKDTSGLIGSFFKWIVWLIALVAATNVLQLTQLSQFLNNILLYMPNVIASVVIVLLGATLAHFVSKVVKGSVFAAEVGYGNALAALAKYAILIFTFLAVLIQLGVAVVLLQTVFTGFVAMLAIAGGLAFGLGGQAAAKDAVESVRREVQDQRSTNSTKK